MQISKKLYTGLIITLLALSTIALAVPSAFAVVSDFDVWNPYAFGGPTIITEGSSGMIVDIDGEGAEAYGLVQIYWIDQSNKIGEGYANGAGDFYIEDVLLPEAVAGIHEILAKDSTGVVYPEDFEIIPALTISANKALPGDSLDVTGSGFAGEVPVGIYLGDLTIVTGEDATDNDLDQSPVILGTLVMAVDVTVEGTVNGEDVTGTAILVVTDDGEGGLSGFLADVDVDDGVVTESGLVDVSIDGSINYASGSMTLSASGVDANGGTGNVLDIDVTIDSVEADYEWAEYDVTPSGGIETDDVGAFDDIIVVPNVLEADYGNYLVTAIDADGNRDNPFPADLAIDYYILVNPINGPSGITVTISGRIPANTYYEIRLDTTTIATGTSGSDTRYEETHEISSFLSVDDHTFSVFWDTTKSKDTNFEVTQSPKMALSATSGMSGAVITISSVSGYPFSAGANLTLLLDGNVINSTDDDERFGPANAFTGLFTDLEFTVPSMTPDVYTLELVDEFGASTGTTYTFTVLATPESDMALTGTAYYQGDTLSFNIVSSDDITDMTVTIADPTGLVWWSTNDWDNPALWVAIPGGEEVIPYQNQLFGIAPNAAHATLPSDAPLGSWNWTIVYDADTAGDNIKATGLFTVMERATLGTVSADIAGLVDEISDITDDVATIKTDVSNVEDLLEALDIPDFSDLTDGIASLEVSVDALEATVTGIEDGIATVDTAVGELEGTITSIEGDVATIQTDVGTLQADISDVKANVDNTPAWIAVVLALVAAVAAIFAVITIRQKIAG